MREPESADSGALASPCSARSLSALPSHLFSGRSRAPSEEAVDANKPTAPPRTFPIYGSHRGAGSAQLPSSPWPTPSEQRYVLSPLLRAIKLIREDWPTTRTHNCRQEGKDTNAGPGRCHCRLPFMRLLHVYRSQTTNAALQIGHAPETPAQAVPFCNRKEPQFLAHVLHVHHLPWTVQCSFVPHQPDLGALWIFRGTSGNFWRSPHRCGSRWLCNIFPNHRPIAFISSLSSNPGADSCRGVPCLQLSPAHKVIRCNLCHQWGSRRHILLASARGLGVCRGADSPRSTGAHELYHVGGGPAYGCH